MSASKSALHLLLIFIVFTFQLGHVPTAIAGDGIPRADPTPAIGENSTTENDPGTFLSLQENLDTWIIQLVELLPRLIAALVIFIAGLYFAGLFSRLIKRAMERRESDTELTLLIAQITRWTMIMLGTVAALQHVGFNLTAFLTGLGIIGFTIGFAIQDVSKNFVAGLLLLLQQPFDLGDNIQVSGHKGQVINVDLRATELRTPDGRNVLIPNASVFTSAIVNLTRTTEQRIEIDFKIAPESSFDQISATSQASVRNVPGLLEEPKPTLINKTLSSAAMECSLYYWVDTSQIDPEVAKDIGIRELRTAFENTGAELR